MSGEASAKVAAFISIPRNGSSAVRVTFGLGPNRDQDTGDSPVIHENHQRAAVLKRKYDLAPLFVFCFVRNPYDRCVSWYQYHREAGLEPYRSLSFDAWIRHGLPHHWHRQNETDYRRERISPLLQYGFIDGAEVDFVGRMESFERDLRAVSATVAARCAEKGIAYRPGRRIVRKNRSRRPDDWCLFYSPETMTIVKTLLARDFLAFDYPTRMSRPADR